MAKSALGRGLSSMMGVSTVVATTPANGEVSGKDAVVSIKLEAVLQNPLQPRQHFDEAKLKELAESIKVHGVVQPIIVAKVPEGYRIIVGERRYRASKIAGLTEIPAIVRDFADQQILEIALIENLQREDLNPIEEAQAFQYLLKEHELTHDKLAERLGCSRPAITNALRLLALPDEMRNDLIAGVIKPGHARAILSLSEEKLRYKAWTAIKKGALSVRQAEELVAKMAEGETATVAPKAEKPKLPSDWQEIVERLRESLNADVRILPKSKGRGRLEFHYRNQDELESIVNMLFYIGSR